MTTAWLVAGAAALAITIVLVVRSRRRWLLVTVDGMSMWPTYQVGDRLLVRRAGIDRLHQGTVVVLRLDDAGDDLMIKRVRALPGDPIPAGIAVPDGGGRDGVVPDGCIVVLGDNAAQSYDSRRAGYFLQNTVIGVVVRHIHRHAGSEASDQTRGSADPPSPRPDGGDARRGPGGHDRVHAPDGDGADFPAGDGRYGRP